MQTWTLDWAVRNLIAELLMPPGIWVLSLLLAFFFLRNKPTLQKFFVLISALMIWVTSTSVFAQWLVGASDYFMKWPTPAIQLDLPHQAHHKKPTFKNSSSSDIQAIVVLGGGRRLGAIDSPEYGKQDLSKESLERVRMAAKLAKQTGLPILTTGGRPDATGQSDLSDQAEARIMAMVFKNEYGLNVQWIEDQSNTTQENAVYSAKLLKSEGVHHIYLVTQFWHMPRAQKIFERQGLKVSAIPHGYRDSQKHTPLDFYPSSNGVMLTRQIWHECLGALWYAWRY